MPEKLKIFAISFLIFNILILSSLIFAAPVKSAVSSCSTQVIPGTIQPSASTTLDFNIDNNGSATVVWVKITSPSSNFTITSGSPSTNSISGNAITFTSVSIGESGGQTFNVTVTTGSTETSSETWTVQVSDDSGGASPYTCSGIVNVGISSSNTDTTAPALSSIGVSDIGSSSVKITWTTDESSTSYVEYGKSEAYTSAKSDTSRVTSHSVELTDLSSNTTYYYQLRSADASNNVGLQSGFNFTTAKSSTTITKTETKTVTPTPTPTPAPDRTAPSVVISTDLTIPYEKSPKISGRASDARSSIVKIEYSTDDGKTWVETYSPDVTVKSLPLSVSFDFTPSLSEDGNYKLKVRATDSANNAGLSKTETLIIDRLPPLVGGNIVSFGPQIIYPSVHGAMVTLTNFDQKITLSSVGGAITIDLLLEKQMFSLVKDPDSSLWYGTMNFTSPGVYYLKSKAIDGTGKITQRNLNPIISLPKGKVISQKSGEVVSGAKITIYYQEPRSKLWLVWDAKSFGQKNPQITNAKGEYTLFVPSGVYYLSIQANGFSTSTSSVFSIKNPTPVNSVFKLKEAKIFRFGPFSIQIPNFSTSRVSINLIAPSLENVDYDDKLLNKEAPAFKLQTTDGKEFELVKMRGRPSIVTFISTWAPPAVEQLSVLDKLVKDDEVRAVVVSVQESSFHLTLFQKRAGYTIPIAADQDGLLVEQYNLTSLPTHYFLDRRGIVRKVVSGVLNEAEIKDAIASVRLF